MNAIGSSISASSSSIFSAGAVCLCHCRLVSSSKPLISTRWYKTTKAMSAFSLSSAADLSTAASATTASPSEPKAQPWLIVGLGNPGKMYSGTRHNACNFMFSKAIIGGLLVVSELMVQLEVFAPVRSGSNSGNFSNDRFGKAKGPNLVPDDHCVSLRQGTSTLTNGCGDLSVEVWASRLTSTSVLIPFLVVACGILTKVGFEMVDAIAAAEGISMSSVTFKALFGKGFIGNVPVMLAKPQTFMNASGESVGAIVSYYKIPMKQVLVIFDDLDLPFAKLRLLPKGGHGGHNGMRSVIDRFKGNRDFPRLRIGIGRPPGKMDAVNFVLRPFNKQEQQEIYAMSVLFVRSTDEVSAIVIDLGSHTCKAGYAGEDAPKAVFPSVVGSIDQMDVDDSDNLEKNSGPVPDSKNIVRPFDSEKSKGKRKLFVGSQTLGYRRDHMEVLSPIKDGVVADWDIVESIWDHGFRDCLLIDPKEHPMLLAEPSSNSQQQREKANGHHDVLHTLAPRRHVLEEAPRCPGTTVSLDSTIWDKSKRQHLDRSLHGLFAGYKSMWTGGKNGSLPSKAPRALAPRCLALDSLTEERDPHFPESVITVWVVLA
ncbi:peptidyl-tRNA hydrolase family protein [Actinidia rufa]|uniref:peptidyl-tRNA hydrolase n=1 Tax=Actinidia rufa TaxID=165716 RepID=A0A7J0GN51_9ERIC|nr:peptidyl-tRNA hydrolase family protein [Actinidia rufa]